MGGVCELNLSICSQCKLELSNCSICKLQLSIFRSVNIFEHTMSTSMFCFAFVFYGRGQWGRGCNILVSRYRTHHVGNSIKDATVSASVTSLKIRTKRALNFQDVRGVLTWVPAPYHVELPLPVCDPKHQTFPRLLTVSERVKYHVVKIRYILARCYVILQWNSKKTLPSELKSQIFPIPKCVTPTLNQKASNYNFSGFALFILRKLSISKHFGFRRPSTDLVTF